MTFGESGKNENGVRLSLCTDPEAASLRRVDIEEITGDGDDVKMDACHSDLKRSLTNVTCTYAKSCQSHPNPEQRTTVIFKVKREADLSEQRSTPSESTSFPRHPATTLPCEPALSQATADPNRVEVAEEGRLVR